MAKKPFMGIHKSHVGFCSPMTKATCTPRRKALARTLKKHHGFHKKETGGVVEQSEDNQTADPVIPSAKTGKKIGKLPKRVMKKKKDCNC